MPNIHWHEMTCVRPITDKRVLFRGPAADMPEREAGAFYMSGRYDPTLDIPWRDTLGRPITEFCPTHWAYIDIIES
jgi:hypothetical protein